MVLFLIKLKIEMQLNNSTEHICKLGNEISVLSDLIRNCSLVKLRTLASNKIRFRPVPVYSSILASGSNAMDWNYAVGDSFTPSSDEEFASKAVLFVIASARRGIHAHCTEVALLFQKINDLQMKLAKLKAIDKALGKPAHHKVSGGKKKSSKHVIISSSQLATVDLDHKSQRVSHGKKDKEVMCLLRTENEIQLEKKLQQYESRIKELEVLLSRQNTGVDWHGKNTEDIVKSTVVDCSENLEKFRVLGPCPLAGCVCNNCQNENDAEKFVLQSQLIRVCMEANEYMVCNILN